MPHPLPGCEQHEFKSNAYFECFIRALTATIYHPVSTCKMGKNLNDTSAVVDPWLRFVRLKIMKQKS